MAETNLTPEELERRRKRAEISRRWRLNNPEKVKAIEAKRKAKRRAYLTAHKRKWRKKYPERVRAANKKWEQKNKEKHKAWMKAYQAQWWKDHPEFSRLHCQRRRARRLADGGNVTMAQWRAIVAQHGSRCFYCHTPLVAGVNLTMDHKVCFANGGKHEPSNVVPACGSCNSRKHTKSVDQFLSEIDALR